MSDGNDQSLRRFQPRDDDGGYRVANDGRPATPRPIRRLNAPITEPFPVLRASDGEDVGEHVEDLIAGYAFGALEPDERLAVERHAAYCARCARQLADARRTAAMLPFLPAPAVPSPDVKAALFSRIGHSSAPVRAERADELAWARPVPPQRSVTLPSSGPWLEAAPVIDAPLAAVARSRRSRASLVRAAGISLPVLLTFGLLAFFVVPQLLPSDDPQNQQLVRLLSSGPAECGQQQALVTSARITSACGIVTSSRLSNGDPIWTLDVGNLVDDTPQPDYVLNIRTTDGLYQTMPNTMTVSNRQGRLMFVRPANASDEQVCLTERGEDPNVACVQPTPAA